MPANKVRVLSPPRLTVSLTSFFASGTSSALIIRATRKSTLVKSSMVQVGAIGSASKASPESLKPVGAGVVGAGVSEVVAGAASLLSSIMAWTFSGAIRCKRCSNLDMLVPTSGVWLSFQCWISTLSRSPHCCASFGKTGVR